MDWMDYINTVISYALIIPGAIICMFPVRKHLRIPKKILFLILFPSLILYSFLMPFIERQINFISPNTLFLLTIAFCSIGYFVIVDLENIKLFYLVMSSIALLSFGGLAYFMVEAYIINHNLETPFYDTGMVFQWNVTIILTCFIFFPFLYKKTAWTLENFHSKSIWNMVWIIPALITFCNYMMIPINYKNATIGRIFNLYLLVDITLLILFLLFQFMFYCIAQNLIEKNEHEKRTQLLQIQSSQYHTLLTYIEQTRKLRQDFRHTAHTLLSLAQEGEIKKILHYLEEYNQELDSYSPLYFCKHSAANAILAYYMGLAASQDIQTNWNIDLPEQIHISEIDLCAMLGNLLENALQGCTTVPPLQRFINLSIDLTKNHELYLVCVNSFNGFVKKSQHKYLSTKKDGNGIGLLSITITVEKYNGIARFYHSESEFYSEIMLKLS